KPKPAVRVEPQSTIYTGDTVTLICELQLSLTGWKFLWYKNTQSNYLTADENTNTISITVSNTGTEEYKCVARRGETYYTHYSDPVKITVRERPKAKVKVQPAEHVFIRERVTLTCDIEGGDVWSYEWFKNNKRLSEAERRKKYEISNADQSDEGDYSCKGTKSTEPRYSETSDAVRLTVSEKPKPAVRVEPQSTVYPGDTVTLICELQLSLTGWKFLWYKNTQSVQLTADKNTNTISITVSNTGTEEYKCVAHRGETYTHITVIQSRLQSERPKAKVKVQPAEHVFIRERVTLTCDIEGGDVWSYEWFKNNKRLSEAERRKKYEISNVDQSDEGDYSCKGTKSTEPRYSETSDAVRLTVSEKPKPAVRVEPQSTIYTGDTVTLICELQLSLTGWKFLWYKNSQSVQLTADENTNTISITVSNTGTEEYKCVARRGETYTHYSDPVKITVRERQSTEPNYSKTSDAVTVSGSGSSVSDTGSSHITAGVAVGLSLTLLVIIILSLFWCYKKKKDDSSTQPSDVTYAQVVTTKKKLRGNGKTTGKDVIVYSELKRNTDQGL
ncbi:B-cell receptor CD22-like, partial [Colossoma macropomum]|uniref:B-cell receptor CD22-like n=1 Tax=Colossoma macropomum TaxID=42526 RepID=UPI0018653F3E